MAESDEPTSTDIVLEMGREIQSGRHYFNAVCDGLDFQASGPYAYEYYFTVTADRDFDWGERNIDNLQRQYVASFINDNPYTLWEPVEGGTIPPGAAMTIPHPYRTLPVKNVTKYLTWQAAYVKEQLESARSNADGIANMQADDFDAIASIATSLGMQNRQIDALLGTLETAITDAQLLREGIQDNWESDGSRLYADRVGDFKGALIQLSEASDAMKNANITVANHINDLMTAIYELWKTRVESVDDLVSGIVGGAKGLVDWLKDPNPMDVVVEVVDVVGGIITKMATNDVEDRIEKLRTLGDMANKLAPIESAATAAGEVVFPQLPKATEWVEPRLLLSGGVQLPAGS